MFLSRMSVSKPDYVDCADAPLALLQDFIVSDSASGLESIHVEREGLVELIQKLKAKCRQDQRYRKFLHEARKFIPTSEQAIYSKTLSEDENYRLTLIGLHSLERVPVHDHPGTVSVLVVLSGKIRIRHFHETAGRQEQRLIELEQCSEEALGKNEIDVVNSEAGSLHSLEASTNNAVFLCIQLPPCPAEKQSWYYPLSPFESSHEPSLWKRSRNPAGAI